MKVLPSELIDAIFESAEHQSEYLLALYSLAQGDFDLFKQVIGYPQVSKCTNEYLFQKAIDFDSIHHPKVLAGGLWMNKGFGTSDDVPDWKVKPAKMERTVRQWVMFLLSQCRNMLTVR